MNESNKNSIWNRRKGELIDDKNDLISEKDFNDAEENQDELIWSVQRRFSISREEAKNMIRNSDRIGSKTY